MFSFKGWRCQKGGGGSEQGSALHALNDEHGSKAQHGCAAIDHLSLGGEGAKGLSLGAPEDGDDARCSRRKKWRQ